MRTPFTGARTAMLMPLIAALVACNNDTTSTNIAAPTDTTAPALSDTSPVNGATAVARNSILTASFDEDIFAATVDGISFTLAAGGSVAGTVTFNGTTNVASFMPSSNLLLLKSYTATLTTVITDLSGNPLASNYAWSFTTADGVWGTAALIETDNAGYASSPQIAVDASGNAIAVWHQFDGARTNIYANRYTVDSGWGTVTLIETDNAEYAAEPRVGVDASGNATAVWVQHDGTRFNVYANRYDIGTDSWGAVALIETNNAGVAAKPQVAVDTSGNAMVVWWQYDGARYNTWANRSTAGAGWGAVSLIETGSAGDAVAPQIAVDASGNAMAVWAQSDGTQDNIYANRFE